jgi:hypothetical protein
MIRRFIGSLVTAILLLGSAHAEPVNCQKQIVKNLLKFKKTYLKKVGKCVDNQNLGKLSGPCPDTATQLKLDTLAGKIRTKIELSCPDPDLATLGFPSSCAFETTATGIESTCKALPVTTPGEFADCLLCWKGAELASFLGVLYASHAVEICDGALDETSPTCSELDCATPLPSQHDLGDTGENDCQKAIGKAGIKHLVSIEKVLEKCGLLGSDRATCLADLAVQEGITKSQVKLETGIKNKCGNRDPIPDPPFCCRTGMGNACSVATSRADCEDNLGGNVQEGKRATPAAATRSAAAIRRSRGGAPARSRTPATARSTRSTSSSPASTTPRRRSPPSSCASSSRPAGARARRMRRSRPAYAPNSMSLMSGICSRRYAPSFFLSRASIWRIALARDAVGVADLLQRRGLFVVHERFQAALEDDQVLAGERLLEVDRLLADEAVVLLVGDRVGGALGAGQKSRNVPSSPSETGASTERSRLERRCSISTTSDSFTPRRSAMSFGSGEKPSRSRRSRSFWRLKNSFRWAWVVPTFTIRQLFMM